MLPSKLPGSKRLTALLAANPLNNWHESRTACQTSACRSPSPLAFWEHTRQRPEPRIPSPAVKGAGSSTFRGLPNPKAWGPTSRCLQPQQLGHASGYASPDGLPRLFCTPQGLTRPLGGRTTLRVWHLGISRSADPSSTRHHEETSRVTRCPRERHLLFFYFCCERDLWDWRGSMLFLSDS